jgi:hypothetical protein
MNKLNMKREPITHIVSYRYLGIRILTDLDVEAKIAEQLIGNSNLVVT